MGILAVAIDVLWAIPVRRATPRRGYGLRSPGSPRENAIGNASSYLFVSMVYIIYYIVYGCFMLLLYCILISGSACHAYVEKYIYNIMEYPIDQIVLH